MIAKKKNKEIAKKLELFRRDDGKELDMREKLFILEYLADPDFSALAAAKRAGYTNRTARSKSCLWVRNRENPKPYILNIIQTIVRNVIQEKASAAEMVIRELKTLAFSDVGNYYSKLGREGVEIEDFKSLPAEVRRSVESVEAIQMKGGNYKFKFKLHSKTKALEILAKVLGLSKERLDVNVTGELTHNVKVVNFVVPMFQKAVELPQEGEQ